MAKRSPTPTNTAKPVPAGKVPPEISAQLKAGREQHEVVGPLVALLVGYGWNLAQLQFGRKEWLVPKSPSQATKREKGQSFDGFPVDIVVFDSPKRAGYHANVLVSVETKQ